MKPCIVLMCSTDWSECGIRVCSASVLLCVVVLCYHKLYSVIMGYHVFLCVIMCYHVLACVTVCYHMLYMSGTALDVQSSTFT